MYRRTNQKKKSSKEKQQDVLEREMILFLQSVMEETLKEALDNI